MNRQSWNRSSTLQATQRVVPLLIMLVALLALLATMTGPVGLSGTLASNAGGQGAAGQGNTTNEDNQHCPDHSDNPKAEGQGTHTLEVDGETVVVEIDGSTVEFFDEDGNPITVEFCIKSAQEQSGKQIGSSGESPATNNKGEPQDISYVVVYRIVEPECPGENGGISLAHSDGSDDPATNDVNDPHSVTATVFDEDDNPCPGANVRFEVDSDGSPTPDGGTETTDDDGEADFEYSNSEAGTDTITACTNADGSLPDNCADADHSASVTKIWVEPTGPTETMFCRSDPVTLGLGGEDVLIPFQANEPSDPCETDADGLLVALSPLLGEGGLGLLNDKNQIELSQEGFGSLTLDLLWARTEGGDDSAHAESGVLYFVANDGTSDQIILEVATSENSTDADCNTTTMATLLAITLAGERFQVTDGNVVLIDPALDDLVIIRFEDGNEGGADEGPDNTGAQALDVGALMNNITATLADSESGCS